MIYFDNAASTLKKPLTVKWAVMKATRTYTANPGRGGHSISYKTSVQVHKTRKQLQKFFNATAVSNVIFTSGCTEALNLAIQGTKNIGGHIVVTATEHNSVLRCVQHLCDTQNINYSIALPNENGEITASAIKHALMSKTYLVIVNHTSNVTGSTNHITEIGKLCHENNLLFLVDAAQSAGHININVQDQHINMLALAGHKGLCALQGVGALIINGAQPKPIKFGGTGTQSESIFQPTQYPESLESGTLPTPAILSLGAGVKYVSKHFNIINNKIERLTQFLLKNMKELKEIKLYSKNAKSGIVSFEVLGVDSNEVVNLLNEKFNICTRGGLHCAPLIHKHLHKNTGLVRLSLSHFNTLHECKIFIKSLKKTLKIIKLQSQHNTTQHNTTQHNTTQHNTTQHNTTQALTKK